jgi:hypothetical protein
MLRDVLVASMNKGQLPPVLLTLIILSLIWRMPSTDVGKLVFALVDGVKSGWLVGYIAAGASILGWYFHARYQRHLITGEMRRIANERSALQSQTLGKKLRSSEGRK